MSEPVPSYRKLCLAATFLVVLVICLVVVLISRARRVDILFPLVEEPTAEEAQVVVEYRDG